MSVASVLQAAAGAIPWVALVLVVGGLAAAFAGLRSNPVRSRTDRAAAITIAIVGATVVGLIVWWLAAEFSCFMSPPECRTAASQRLAPFGLGWGLLAATLSLGAYVLLARRGGTTGPVVAAFLGPVVALVLLPPAGLGFAAVNGVLRDAAGAAEQSEFQQRSTSVTVTVSDVKVSMAPEGGLVTGVSLRASLRPDHDIRLAMDGPTRWPEFRLCPEGGGCFEGTPADRGPTVLAGGTDISYQVSFLPVAGQPSRPRTAMNIGAGRPVADVPGPPVPGTWLLETTLYDEAGRQYLLETRVAVGPVA